MDDVTYYAFLLEGAFQRNLKPSEIEYVELWVKKEIPLYEIIRAYGLMMKKCEKSTFAYMAKILENWYQKGDADNEKEHG